MRHLPTPEQDELVRAERSWLVRNDPIERLRGRAETAPITVDSAAVNHASESGLLTLLTPDVGGAHTDLAVVAEAHGYAGSSLPLADIAIAHWLLATEGVSDGSGSPENVGLVSAASERSVGGACPTAILPMVEPMKVLALVGRDESGDYLKVSSKWIVRPMSTLDLTRSWSRVQAGDGELTRRALSTGTTDYVADALALHRAWDSVGAAARLLDMTVTYVGQRTQFDALIGSFQAVKHHCANMVVAVEAARAALWSASVAIDAASPDDRRRAIAAAVAYAKNAASDVASTALQVHGGIGFTWEHDLHLFLRRIKVNRAMNGTVEAHRALLTAQ